MAVLWDKSLLPVYGSGAKAYFFNVSTTTPQTTYTDSALSIPHDHPVVANGNGAFPAVFLPDESTHRLRIVSAGGDTIWDIDGISVPTTTPPEFPDSETPPEKTISTGHVIWALTSTAPTGYVRANGRTIGSAASGATERANSDCEDLFIYLWNNTSLTVAGGRGSTAEGDWAADKTIALLDLRGRVVIGPDSFGNSAAGRVTDSVLGEDSDTLLSAGGAETHTLVEAELPAHGHAVSGETSTDGAHTHDLQIGNGYVNNANNTGSSSALQSKYVETTSNGDHSHTVTGTAADTGSDDPHNNLQPSIVLPAFIKL